MRRGLGLVVVFAVAGVFAWAIVSKRKRTAVNDPKLNAWLQRPGTTPDPATLVHAFRYGALSEVFVPSEDPTIRAAEELGFETYRRQPRQVLDATDADVLRFLRQAGLAPAA